MDHRGALVEQGFKDTFKYSCVGLVILDLNGKFVEANEAFYSMLGYELNEICELTFQEITYHEDLAICVIKVNCLLNREQPAFSVEKRYLHKNGSFIWARSNVSLLKDPLGDPIGIVAIVQNIDEIKRSEMYLKQAMKYRDDFLMMASHELRTPLTSIKLQSQMLQRQMENETDPGRIWQKEDRLLRLTEEGMNRMSHLFDNMIDIAKIQEGKLIFDKKVVDPGTILLRTLSKYEIALKKASISFSSDIQIGSLVMADPARLEQVFTNLILNCINYAPGSSVSISLSPSEDNVEILFKDSGPGIPAADLNKIFHRFEKLLSTTNVKGLGLGLFIVKSILKGHQGSIHVSSELGRGAEFAIRVPRHYGEIPQQQSLFEERADIFTAWKNFH